MYSILQAKGKFVKNVLDERYSREVKKTLSNEEMSEFYKHFK